MLKPSSTVLKSSSPVLKPSTTVTASKPGMLYSKHIDCTDFSPVLYILKLVLIFRYSSIVERKIDQNRKALRDLIRLILNPEKNVILYILFQTASPSASTTVTASKSDMLYSNYIDCTDFSPVLYILKLGLVIRYSLIVERKIDRNRKVLHWSHKVNSKLRKNVLLYICSKQYRHQRHQCWNRRHQHRNRQRQSRRRPNKVCCMSLQSHR